MPIATLTTDLGLQDHYLASLKAKLISQIVDCQIIDVSHRIQKFNISEAAFLLKNILADFPKNTVHIVDVNAPSASDRHLGIKYNEQFIICADHGLFSLVADRNPDEVVELTLKQESDYLTFPARDMYVPAAAHLLRGGTLSVIGRKIEDMETRTLMRPLTSQNSIRGSVIHVDSYGNAITNITAEVFQKVGSKRPFIIQFRMPGYDIESLSLRYSDVVEGERLAILSSTGNLEIAINCGHAANLLGLNIGEIVIIEFYDS